MAAAACASAASSRRRAQPEPAAVPRCRRTVAARIRRPRERERDPRIAKGYLEARETFYLLDGQEHLVLAFHSPGSDVEGLDARAKAVIDTLRFGDCK
jgi:hypothetical protein